MVDTLVTAPKNLLTIGPTFSYRVIYVYSIPLESHQGRLKIGETAIESSSPEEVALRKVAEDRIKQQTQTADIPYTLEYVEIAVKNNGGGFTDKDVHEILIRSGFPRKSENVKNQNSEWFEVSLDIVKSAIQAAKEGRIALTTEEIVAESFKEFPFRPNQLDAIDKTLKAIEKKRPTFLWNAKMRFGKTTTALEVAKRSEAQKVLIVTHRPSVNVDWEDDFKKIFSGTKYQYSSKTKGENIKTHLKNNAKFIYFASLQDLRGSKYVVEDEEAKSKAAGFDKNDEIFETTWDMLIIDEAHEGTQSDLGETTFKKIARNFTLLLSGTPFNLLYKQESRDIYTWDYVMEQEAKLNWDTRYPGVPNPYSDLPAISMFTYDIKDFAGEIGQFGDLYTDAVDGAFKFHEFFRLKQDDEGGEVAEFVHENMVKRFLDLLVDESQQTKFPYATPEYRSFNKHTLWLLPNRVKVIKAIEKLLKEHPVFGSNEFGIVNISGNSRDDEEDVDAKNRVVKAIKNHEFTITLTGQRLTTGASIPEWTAVFMLSDTNSATTYLQTAFRCQTPHTDDEGRVKTRGYIFDFAPDRTLRLVAEAIELNHKTGQTNTSEQTKAMQEFLNFCPILASSGGTMKPFEVNTMLTKLKEAIIDRVSRSGFDDPKLYNDNLLDLGELAVSEFNELGGIIGYSTKKSVNELRINKHGMDELKRKRAELAEQKKKREELLTEAEKEALKALKKEREEKLKQKRDAISILRGVSIRMPLLVFGAEVKLSEDITLEKFIDLVDEESWREFMPQGLTKEKFSKFTKYYDPDVFRGVTRNIRAQAQEADELLPLERIQAIATLFNTFKNPDKETVLTPWKVVNMHLTGVFGGHDFNDVDREDNPRWKSKDLDTSVWTDPDTKILEINSKSGLYPLLAAYNIYTRKLKTLKKPEERFDKNKLWREVLDKHIFVLCKSPMAKSITRRTLAGYSGAKTNIAYVDNLVAKLQQKDSYAGYNVTNDILRAFNFNSDMRFTAVVGNPPYQGENHQQIYPNFYLSARELGNYVSLIFPVGWQEPKNANNLRALNSKEIKEDSQIVKIDNRQNVFPGISGAEWTNIILWRRGYDNGLEGKQKIYTNGKDPQVIKLATEYDASKKPKEIRELARLVQDNAGFKSMQLITSVRKPYGLSTDVIKDPKKYKLPPIFETQQNSNDIRLYGIKGKMYYLDIEYPLPRRTKAFDKFKVFVPYAWGNMSEKVGLGGAYSNIIVARPNEAVTETYQEQGPFKSLNEARFHAKYLMTKFARALLYLNKHSQHSTTSWGAVPVQDFSEDWWSKSIQDIDEELMNKYSVPQDIKDFVFNNIQTKTEENIVNYSG